MQGVVDFLFNMHIEPYFAMQYGCMDGNVGWVTTLVQT